MVVQKADRMFSSYPHTSSVFQDCYSYYGSYVLRTKRQKETMISTRNKDKLGLFKNFQTVMYRLLID